MDARHVRLRPARRATRSSAATTHGSAWPPSAPSASIASTPASAKGLTPGVDPEATPACVNSCIADALHFGDADDPDEQRLAACWPRTSTSACTRSSARARASSTCGTATTSAPTNRAAGAGAMSFRAPNPWQQQSWDWRAAGNFMCGGAGGGLIVWRRAARMRRAWFAARRRDRWSASAGSVWLEIGRPLARAARASSTRARRGCHARRSSRRSCSPRGGGVARRAAHAAVAALLAALRSCTARPASCRRPRAFPPGASRALVPLIVATGLAEGAGLLLLWAAFSQGATALLGVLCSAMLARWLLWVAVARAYRAAAQALTALDSAASWSEPATLLRWRQRCLPSPCAADDAARVLQVPAARSPCSGAWFKFTLRHARRVQPGLRAAALAGARCSALR